MKKEDKIDLLARILVVLVVVWNLNTIVLAVMVYKILFSE